MYILDSNAIHTLSAALNLPITGKEQDWDIEMATPNRIVEFLDYYEANLLLPQAKQALMALVLASFEDAVSMGERSSRELWGRIVSIISKDVELHKPVLSYWAYPDAEMTPGDGYNITDLAQQVLQEMPA